MTQEIQKLINKFHNTGKYSKKRKALTEILRKNTILHFNYVKLNSEIKRVTVIYNSDYTYEIPPTDSDFIYLFDSDSGIFKHFKLLRISDIEFSFIGKG